MNNNEIIIFKKINIDIFTITFNSFINFLFNIFLSSIFFLYESHSVVITIKLNKKKFNLFLILEIY